MTKRWPDRLSGRLSAHLRRGALFVLALVSAATLTLTPVVSQEANAQGITDLLSVGGSFTNGLSTCSIETVGWIVCPTMLSIARLADYGFTYINKNFLRIDYDLTSDSSGTYKAWSIMRSVADALFVVAFMVLVYSQLTGKGGSYNMKRLVPKLIISAILVNVSYYLCVALIDITNIVGDSLMTILQGVASKVGHSVMPIGGQAASGYQDGTLTTITSSAMAKAGVAWVLLTPIAAVTVSIATISAAGLVLLIMRKTVVAMLILGSPVLFVAYLLPNLERVFFQGVRLFGQLLLLYPIIALLLGAGQIVSATIVTVGSGDANYRVSGDSYFAANGGSGSSITDLTASAAAVVPLLGVWFIYKNMSSLMSSAGTRLSASLAGRRGGKSEDKAKVTGNAVSGAANKISAGVGPFNRRQAFSRGRRRASLGGSMLPSGNAAQQPGGTSRPGPGAGVNAQSGNVAQMAAENALASSVKGKGEDMDKQLEGLNEAKIEGSADGLNIENAMSNAIDKGNAKEHEDRKITAKDLFNNLNQAHESKDKDRKFSAGPAPAGGGGGQQSGGGSSGPTAPTNNYRAPQMAQGGNIVSGSAPSQPVKIVAVPVQVDPSALLGQKNTMHPPENISQPPISGTEEKAKARAQKYLFDAQRDINNASDKVDVLGHKDELSEAPHTDTHQDKHEHDDDDK